MNPKHYQRITLHRCRKIIERYERYAGPFLAHQDPEFRDHIRLKYEHINRVREEMRSLCHSLAMDEEQIAFADILATLHDIGRFEQFDRYATFADAESENHSELAWRITIKLGIREELTDNQAEIIRNAILNHNVAAIPGHIGTDILFYSRLIRDADKLDIWRVSLEYNIFNTIRKESFPAVYKVPRPLLKHFEESRTIDLTLVDSFYDSVLFRLSWIFDLNFKHTVTQFRERRIAEQLLDKLPHSEELVIIREWVARHVKRKIDNMD